MDAQQAFAQFVQRCVSPEKARRFMELSVTKKGQRKVLAGLYHESEAAVRLEAIQRAGSAFAPLSWIGYPQL
jgi:hypothetical protein